MQSEQGQALLCSSPEKVGGIEPHVVFERHENFNHLTRGLEEYFDSFIPQYLISEPAFEFLERTSTTLHNGAPRSSLYYLHDESDVKLKSKRSVIGLHENSLLVSCYSSDKAYWDKWENIFSLIEDSMRNVLQLSKNEQEQMIHIEDKCG